MKNTCGHVQIVWGQANCKVKIFRLSLLPVEAQAMHQKSNFLMYAILYDFAQCDQSVTLAIYLFVLSICLG